MNSNDWKNLFKSVAPALGTALGSPLAGAAAAFIADRLGIESKTVESVTEVLNSGKLLPDQIEKIQLAEIDFQKFLETNKIDMAKINVDNTKDARLMQMTTRSNMPAVMSLLITVGFFGILGYMLTDDYKSSEPLLVMLGSLGTAWVAVVNFWFGSSHGSMQKNEALTRK